MKNDDQHCTLIDIFGPNTMEHVYGILLDQKFLYRSVHAAFREHEVPRVVVGAHPLLGPDLLRRLGPGVLSWTPGQPCNSHHARHTTHRHLLFRVCVVVLSCITSRSVAAAAASSARSDAFFHGFLAQSVAATRRIFVGVSVHHSFWMCLVPCL